MEKDKSPSTSAGFQHQSALISCFTSPTNVSSMKQEQSALSTIGNASKSEVRRFDHGESSDSACFSHDISRMSDNPSQSLGHRRAHSEILTLPDDISFDSDLGFVAGIDGPSFSDDTEEDLLSMYLDMDKLISSSATSEFQVGESSFSPPFTTPAAGSGVMIHSAGNVAIDSTEKPRVRHQHSASMDGSTTMKQEMLASSSEVASAAENKKAMSAAKLAELALIDPKRAKRIWANRQSAARSKERKMRYIAELERKVHALQTEATTLSAQLTMLHRDTNGISSENNELKMRLQTMERQVHLQDALNDSLKEEIQHMKVLTGQTMPNGGGPMVGFMPAQPYAGCQQQFYPSTQPVHPFLTTQQQFQHLHIHPQRQEQSQQQISEVLKHKGKQKETHVDAINN